MDNDNLEMLDSDHGNQHSSKDNEIMNLQGTIEVLRKMLDSGNGNKYSNETQRALRESIIGKDLEITSLREIIKLLRLVILEKDKLIDYKNKQLKLLMKGGD